MAFDSFIGIAWESGLLITYFSFFGLFGNIFFPLNRHRRGGLIEEFAIVERVRVCIGIRLAEDRRQPALWEWSTLREIMTNATTAAAKTGLIQNTPQLLQRILRKTLIHRGQCDAGGTGGIETGTGNRVADGGGQT